MSAFLQRVESEIRFRRLLLPGQKILVAVSGGVDSMVLLHVFQVLAPKHGWNICVAHFNHQLRGRASQADEKLVRATARNLGWRFVGESGDVAGLARSANISVEMAARKLRHDFLARVARRQKISTVALAHHADDQVELFFLRLLRGAGGAGLAGMKWGSPSSADKKITLVRPLLGCAKAELVAFARENHIRFRADASNASADFLRNRIRNDLLPLLQKEYQPGLAKTVLRGMEIIGDEAEFVSQTAQAWLANVGRADLPVSLISTETKFNQLSIALQRQVLQQQLMALGVTADFEMIEQLRQMPETFVSVSSSCSVARNGDGKLAVRAAGVIVFKADELALKLAGRAGRLAFADRNFRWQIQLQRQFIQPAQHAGSESLDADKVGGEIILRHWRAGDRFQPIGLKSPAKLQDLFVNAKIPAARRRELVLATTAAGEIFWVEGLRLAEAFKLTPATRRKLTWRWNLAKGGGTRRAATSGAASDEVSARGLSRFRPLHADGVFAARKPPPARK